MLKTSELGVEVRWYKKKTEIDAVLSGFYNFLDSLFPSVLKK